MKLFNLLERDLNESPKINLKKNPLSPQADEKPADHPGLSSSEAAKRLRENGPNSLSQGKKVNAMKIFAGQFKDFLTLILLASTLISLFMGEYAEALTIAVIVLLNAIMGFAQEFKTEKTLEALKKMAAPHAKVFRDGKLTELPTDNLVCGDIIEFEAGDKIPADALILECSTLESDEAMLTGESLPSEKHSQPSAKDFTGHDKEYLVYMGCTVTKGHGTAKVIATGMNTQMGQIADMLVGIEEEETPLQKKLGELGKYIAIGCLIICAIVSLTGILRGEPVLNMLITGLSLSVAAVPEGLPAIVTIALALAVNRMVKQKSLIRRLHAVETLGCASVICSDKTGTLTENKMTVKKIVGTDYHLEVTGNGYEKAGEFRRGNTRMNINLQSNTKKLFEVAVLCNNSRISAPGEAFGGRDRTSNQANGCWNAIGDPTETALLIMAAKAGVTNDSLEHEYTRIDEIPFDSKRKCMSVVVRNKSGKRLLLTKGGYDILMQKCIYIATQSGVSALTDNMKKEMNRENDQMASNALRVLGIAYREISDSENDPKEEGLIFLGMVGMIDPPRNEAKQSVALCRKAGIKTVMITGDHKLTATAIASQLGIFHQGNIVVTGQELDRMSDDDLTGMIEQTTVFARVNPSHKLKIVRAFKRLGHVVAMTGDGVNDAPAVKEADIGVAMGNGTDVTKEASDVILLDSNFATLVTAIEEGRTIYGNIRKFIRYLLACNIGEVLTMFLGMLMGFPVILLPIHILLINLVTDGLPAIALGLEPKEDGIMEKKPRSANAGIFADGLLFKIVFRGILIGLTTLAVFSTVFKMYGSLEFARTSAFATLVLTQLIHVFECKSEEKTIFSIPYFNNYKLIFAVLISLVIVLSAIYLPVLQPILKTVTLPHQCLWTIILYSMAVPVISALEKSISKQWKNHKLLTQAKKD